MVAVAAAAAINATCLEVVEFGPEVFELGLQITRLGLPFLELRSDGGESGLKKIVKEIGSKIAFEKVLIHRVMRTHILSSPDIGSIDSHRDKAKAEDYFPLQSVHICNELCCRRPD